MDIGLIGTLPEDGQSFQRGPERTTIGLSEALNKRGHNVTVFSDEGKSKAVDVESHVLCPETSPGLKRVAHLYYKLRKRIDPEDYDIIHSWRVAPYTDVLSLHSIGTAREVEAKLPGTYSKRWMLGESIIRQLRRKVAKNASTVVMTAEANKHAALRYGFPVEHVIPVGIKKDFLMDDDADDYVLNVGRVEPRKNQKFIVENTPDIKPLTLVGPLSDEEYSDSIDSFDKYWVGKQPEDKLKKYYKNANIFALPSILETFGLTAVEAMAAGTPVIVSDSCAVSEHINGQNGKVYSFNNATEYRNAIEQITEDRDEFSRNAKEYVENNLTWDVIAEKYEEVYKSV